VLLDLLGGSAVAAAAARRALADALGDGAAVLCPPVYAELAVAFADARELEQFLGDLHIAVEGFTTDALLAAAEGWRRT